jgi:hypothetical protein
VSAGVANRLALHQHSGPTRTLRRLPKTSTGTRSRPSS